MRHWCIDFKSMPQKIKNRFKHMEEGQRSVLSKQEELLKSKTRLCKDKQTRKSAVNYQL